MSKAEIDYDKVLVPMVAELEVTVEIDGVTIQNVVPLLGYRVAVPKPYKPRPKLKIVGQA